MKLVRYLQHLSWRPKQTFVCGRPYSEIDQSQHMNQQRNVIKSLMDILVICIYCINLKNDYPKNEGAP